MGKGRIYYVAEGLPGHIFQSVMLNLFEFPKLNSCVTIVLISK
jgi:hypothetical protein